MTERRLDEGNYANYIYLIKFSVQKKKKKTSDLPEAKFKRNITNSGSTRSFICRLQCLFLIDLKKRDYFESASANLEIDRLKALNRGDPTDENKNTADQVKELNISKINCKE